MPVINQSNWHFEFSNTTLIDKHLGILNSPTIVSFETSVELVRYMADDQKDDYVRMQRCIDDRIDADTLRVL